MGAPLPQRRVSLLLRKHVRGTRSYGEDHLMRAALLIALLLAGCGSTPEQKAATPPAPPVKDNRLLLPGEHQTAARIVPDHLLGKTSLPGGTIGDYEDAGKKYQLFVIDTKTPQDAAFLLLDFKAILANPAYIAYMGGYSGMDGETPVYVFAKGIYVAGVVGLSKDAADPIARQFAARLK